jgi:hypothetical protein
MTPNLQENKQKQKLIFPEFCKQAIGDSNVKAYSGNKRVLAKQHSKQGNLSFLEFCNCSHCFYDLKSHQSP